MSKRDVLLYPDKRLKNIANKVNNMDETLFQVINDLKDTMDYYDHTVGLAAPQIGYLLRIITIEVSKHTNGKKINHGNLIMINPEILDWKTIITTREGCLSIPDYTGNVNRAKHVSVKYIDISGKQKQLSAEGFEAVVIQHEIDHLDGILFIDRIISKRKDLFRRSSK